MPEEAKDLNIKSWILIPAAVTLAVTLIRLLGELFGGPDFLFNASAGGAGALVGIVWLVPVFGIYFAVKLSKHGRRPVSMGKTIGAFLAALALMVASYAVGFFLFGPDPSIGALVYYALVSLAVIYISLLPWPDLGRLLLAYGFAARIPVVLIMLVAILGDWGTHYDVPPPGLTIASPIVKWFFIGLLPQFTFWIAFTTIIGGFFGALGAALVRGSAGGVQEAAQES